MQQSQSKKQEPPSGVHMSAPVVEVAAVVVLVDPVPVDSVPVVLPLVAADVPVAAWDDVGPADVVPPGPADVDGPCDVVAAAAPPLPPSPKRSPGSDEHPAATTDESASQRASMRPS